MNPTLADELAKLKDAHELAPISWWPPALGWWLVAGVILGLLSLLLIKGYPRWRLRRYRRFFLQQLNRVQAKNDARQIQRLNLLIKKMALLAFPREQVAGLTGAAWAAFLLEHGPKNRTLIALKTALGEQQFQSQKVLTSTRHSATDHSTARHSTARHSTTTLASNSTITDTSPIDTPELWKDAQAWLAYILTTRRRFILQSPQRKKRDLSC